MTQASSKKRLVAVLVGEVVLFGVLACKQQQQNPQAQPATPMQYVSSASTLNSNHPECPHDWSGKTIAAPAPQAYDALNPVANPWTRATGFTGFVVPTAGLSAPGPQTDVPEFNDCQRFIITDTTYGPMMAIWAAKALNSIVDAAGESTNEAVAEIFNYSAGYLYLPLGIRPAFNCLYLYGKPGHYSAKIVPVGTSGEPNCGKPIDLSHASGTELAVIETHVKGFRRKQDYPPVVRWDYDAGSHQQYIGLACGAAWCDIGPGKPSNPTAAAFTPTVVFASTGLGSDTERVRAIKAYQDHQPLQECGGTGNTAPSHVEGYIMAAPNLGQLQQTHTWQTTASVALELPPSPSRKDLQIADCYARKFNWALVSHTLAPNQQNVYELCYGTVDECIPSKKDQGQPSLLSSCKQLGQLSKPKSAVWWSRLTAARGGILPSNPPPNPMYRCVNYVAGQGVAYTVNFRFLASDESVWQYCGGCCEVEST